MTSGNAEPEQVPDLPTAEVPDVVGLNAVDACDMVRTAGLIPYGPDQNPEPSIGVILHQSPTAATAATIGDAVFLDTEPGNLAAD